MLRCRYACPGHLRRIQPLRAPVIARFPRPPNRNECTVTTPETTFDKINEHRRIFDTLPNVLIQDPARGGAYYIRAEDLAEFRTTPDTWAQLNDTTVSFVIPDGEVIDEVPSFLRTPEVKPSVLIRYSRAQSSYFLKFEDLQR